MSIDQIDSSIEEITHIIEVAKEKLSNRRLLSICADIGSAMSGKVDPHFYHEIVETAVNALIKRKYATNILGADNPIEALTDVIIPLTKRLPTQTWRSVEQNLWQQFSTPPAIAYLLSYLLNLKKGETVLEPSAGTGNLAAWSSGFRLITYVNEIDSRRRELIKRLDLSPTSFNAEFIDDHLPGDILPDCLIMNPPFSSNGGRTTQNSSKFGFRHVESALERLKPGGKFGIILGNSGSLDTKTGRDFWQKLSETVGVKANIRIAGKEYSKNGTSVGVILTIGTKHCDATSSATDLSSVIQLSIRDIEEGFTLAHKLNLRLD